jgi:hypothetical protein
MNRRRIHPKLPVGRDRKAIPADEGGEGKMDVGLALADVSRGIQAPRQYDALKASWY